MTDQRNVLHWYSALHHGINSSIWVADTPFGPIHVKAQGTHWVCIKHPNASYPYLDVEMRELIYVQVKAEVAYFRALDEALEKRRLLQHPVMETTHGLRAAPLKAQQDFARSFDKAVADITRAEDEEFLRIAREIVDKEEHNASIKGMDQASAGRNA